MGGFEINQGPYDGQSMRSLKDLLIHNNTSQDSRLTEFVDLINEAYALIDTMLVALSSSLSQISSAEGAVQQALIEKQFAEIRKQMEASKSNLLLKIFMPLLMALGIVLLIASPVPIDPATRAILVGLLLVMLTDSVMTSATGESFLNSLFEKIASGNESLANWLLVGFEVIVMLLTLLASMGCAAGNLTQRIAMLSSRVQGFISRLSDAGVKLGAGTIESMRNIATAFAKLTVDEIRVLQQAMKGTEKAFATTPSPFATLLETLGNNPAVKVIKDKLLTEKGVKWVEKACDVAMLLSGIVVGSLSIDKALIEIELAKITREIDILSANADFLKSPRQDLLNRIEKASDSQEFFQSCLDDVISVWKSN